MKKRTKTRTLKTRDRGKEDQRPLDYRDQLALMVEEVRDYAIFMLDAKGRVATWNAGAKRIKGYEPSEIIGKHFSAFYPEEDVRSGKPPWELEVAEREGRFEDEGWRIRKDGSRFWANVIITAIRDRNGKLVGFGKVTRDFTERRQHEEELAQSEERFRLLVEGTPEYAIFAMDADGRISTWNMGAKRIKGYKASEIIGRHYSTFFPEEDAQAGKPQEILERAAKEGSVEIEGWRVRKDGSRFWVNAVVTALRDESGKLRGFSKIVRDVTQKMEQQQALQREITERQRAEADLTRSEQSLRELSLNLLRTQDEERRRIGREMHDSLGQYLSALKMKLGILKVKEDLTPEAAQEIEVCNNLLDECVKEVRTISYLLYPPMLEEMGLKSAISWYLDGFSQRSGVKTTFEVTENFGRVGRDVELAVFRVLQESLTNAHKHSGTEVVDIKMSRSNGSVDLRVRDYGHGLPRTVREQSNASKGVGLRGMRERMLQLGGNVNVTDATPGTVVHATVPTQQSPDSKTNT